MFTESLIHSMNVSEAPPCARQWGWPWGSRDELDQICSYAGGTFPLESETGNTQVNKHVNIQFELGEGLR